MTNDPTNPNYSPWRAPEVVDSRHLRPVDVEAARKLAWEQGYEDGYSIGMEAGMGDARRHMGYLNEILRTLAKPFDDLDTTVASQLAMLVRTIASVILRREVELDTSFLVDVVNKSIEVLPVAEGNVRIVVHPDDAALIEDHLAGGKSERGWQVVIDPEQPRGGCRLVSDIAQIDGSVEHRLERLVATMLETHHGDPAEEPYDV